ncbi:arabinogalactan endo-1,4-beta-galactosidase [Marinilabilia salmonicolor]|jgi:arabinogalactan endo-1,4-beta-galactosidase|uniref:glycoside hydrolase family 53 protein n=1 Tax=Marinilabilia salmonicolor TaxID=989 RepID=UPI000D07081A|nr:glycosyl hydrolase 53 family protein [Marinilabilia salmonicolor]PRZ01299.1 arabinogalactan endo-1,4-beta-galactosidase [Marinilabilia salmonicolor]
MKKQQLVFILALFFTTMMSFACSDDDNGKPVENGTEGEETEIPELPGFIKGLDLSYVNQVEDHGGIYKQEGVAADPFEILTEKGGNLVRVRLWHNPSWVKDIYGDATPVYSGIADVAATIERAHQNGMAVLLDFHYSDTWADPGHQDVPAAWKNITSLDVLTDSVYNYTYEMLSYLKEKNLLPQMVQIGNETNPGMMTTNTPEGFPDLNVYDGNWSAFGQVVNAGIKAVRDIESQSDSEIKVALHIADPKNLEWWMADVINKGNVHDFEIMGFSYYHIWHTTISFDQLPGLVSDLKSTYGKDLLVMETAYPFTTEYDDNYGNIYSSETAPLEGFPFTIEGQKQYLTTLSQNMANAGAIGVIYWEPAWISSGMKDLWGTGSSWENCALFDFDGNVTEAADYLEVNY